MQETKVIWNFFVVVGEIHILRDNYELTIFYPFQLFRQRENTWFIKEEVF